MDRRFVPPLIGLAAFAAFLPALGNGFLNWDDRVILVNNPHYRGLGAEQLRWMFTNLSPGKYQPLAFLSFAIDHAVWGMNPAGYHLSSLLIHAANAVLLYFVGLRLLKHRAAAAFAALLFALHPLRVESVAWAAERGGPLSGFFYLAAVGLYLRSVDEPRRRGLWLAVSAGAYALSLMSKAVALAFPLVLLLLDAYPLRRRFDPKVWFEKLPFLLLAAVFGLIALKAQWTMPAMASLQRFGVVERVAQALYGSVFYLEKAVLPVGLSPLYVRVWPLEAAPHLVNGALAIALTAFFLWARRRWPAGLAVWGYHWLTLLPVLGLVKLGLAVAADRYTYLPAMGWSLFAGAGLSYVPGKRALKTAVAAAVLVPLALLTWRQTMVWRDPLTFWTRAIEIDPGCYVCHRNLGDALVEIGEEEEGSRHLAQSRTLHARIKRDLGEAFYRRGRWAEAGQRFSEALAIQPEDAAAHDGLGLVLWREGRVQEAAEHFRRALQIDPSDTQAATHLRLLGVR